MDKYISEIELSMHSALLNHFSGASIKIFKDNTTFEDEHMVFISQHKRKKFQNWKDKYMEHTGIDINIETIIEESSLGMRSMLYFHTSFNKESWSSFISEPTWNFLEKMRKIRNRISHQYMLYTWITKTSLEAFVKKMVGITRVSGEDIEKIKKYIKIMYN